MENVENQSGSRKIKNFLKAGIIAGSLILSGKGLANSQNNPDNPTPNSEHVLVIPELAKDEDQKPEEVVSEVPFSTFMVGLDSQIENPENVILKTQEEVDSYWKKVNFDANRPAPKIQPGETVFLSVLGKKDGMNATLITKIEKSADPTTNSDQIKAYVESYDIGNEINSVSKSSPYSAVSVDTLNPNFSVEWIYNHIEGKHGFSYSPGDARDDGHGNTEYGPGSLIITPLEQVVDNDAQ
ncbi:MAG: hypothetical protein Q7T54_00985 [Candidatus Levybacteria bacterium]|nr:hypothetical protein [Candidatus Levybacteria bacterium]